MVVVTVELGSGRGLESGLLCNSVMERPAPEAHDIWTCIEIDSISRDFYVQSSTTATRRSYHSPTYMSKTIFPPALFSSIV